MKMLPGSGKMQGHSAQDSVRLYSFVMLSKAKPSYTRNDFLR
jgi:hypothetical protein